MSSFHLSIDATSSFSGGNAPSLEILIGGIVVSSASMNPGSDTYEFTLDFSGNFPSSLQFRFDGGSGDPGDTITFSGMRINGQSLNTGSNLTGILLAQGASQSVVSTASIDHLFGVVEPTLPDIGTATITGTGGADFLMGTSGDDVIDAGGGADTVYGMDGNDGIDGGAGADNLFGMGGNDIILAGADNDFVMGGAGDDLIYGEDGDDTLIGEAGNDTLNGGAGNDGLLGDAGDDILYGEDGDDWLVGDAGNDVLYGGDGTDTLIGGADDDRMYGGNQNDILYGDAGNDTIDGEGGADTVLGGAGADTIDGGTGNDILYGEDGDDVVSGGANDDYVSGGDGNDTLNGDGGNDVLVGGDGADIMDGGAGNDILHGHGMDQSTISSILFNNPGVVYSNATGSFYQYVNSSVNYTTAQAAAAAVTLNGVNGHIVTITSAAENSYVASLISGTAFMSSVDVPQDGTWQWTEGLESGIQFSDISGNSVNGMYDNWQGGQPQINTEFNAVIYTNGLWHDWTAGSSHRYVIEWEAGLMNDDNAADILNGGAGNDWLYGYGGDDTLNGDGNDDFIFGGDGDDTIDGGADNDFIVGGNGSDTITGGTGNDTIYATIVGTVGAQTVTDAGGGGGTISWNFINESFPTDESNFVYADFNDPGNLHASGIYNGSDGDAANGSIQIDIERNGSSYAGAGSTGYWASAFYTAGDVTNTEITFSYRHTHANQNDEGEDSVVFFTLNGVVYDQFGGSGYISTALGIGGATDTGWQTVTITLPDLVAGSVNTIALGIGQTSASSNNEDSMVRFDDIVFSGDVSTVTLIAEAFTSNSSVFAYADSVFGGGSAAYASGTHITTDGDNANGALQVNLGGIDETDIGAHSGGWTTTVNLTEALDNVTLDFSYRMIRSGQYENNEDTYLYVEVDDVKYGINPNDYINTWESNGSSSDIDTGWVTVTLDVGTLSAGSHVVEIGQYSEGKTTAVEESILRLDDIFMTGEVQGGGGNNATSSGNDAAESHIIDGGDGNDTIYGSAGDDYLYGGAGSDTIYSDSSQTYTVADALAEISGLQYNADTGSFYLYISGAVTAPTAFANAAATTLNGVAGHIVHITSALENAYIDTLTGTATTWIGAQDTAVEGEWRWIGGVNDGDLFWLGTSTGSLQGGYSYENWNGGEPNDYVGGEDYVEMQNGGGWNDNGGPNNNGLTRGYVIEWEASEVFSFGATEMNGGAGADDLYGSAGADLFIFDSNGGDAFTNPDTIFNFDANDGDAIDISDILDGLGVTSANLSNYVDVSEANGVRIDTSGSGSFTGNEVATFSGFSAVSDEATMLTNGNLIIA